MIRNQRSVPVNGMIVIILILVNAVILREAYTGSSKWYWVLLLTVPLLLLAIKNVRQRKHAALRKFPVIGYLRHLF